MILRFKWYSSFIKVWFDSKLHSNIWFDFLVEWFSNETLRHASFSGYAATAGTGEVKAHALPPGTSVRQAWLYIPKRACILGQSANIYTDSKYAFGATWFWYVETLRFYGIFQQTNPDCTQSHTCKTKGINSCDLNPVVCSRNWNWNPDN